VCVDNANENENGIRLEKKVKRSRWVVVETQRRGPATSTTGEPNQRGMQLKKKVRNSNFNKGLKGILFRSSTVFEN